MYAYYINSVTEGEYIWNVQNVNLFILFVEAIL